MVKYIERTERLVLALNAGARAIENNKRLFGATLVMDMFSENPKEISYCEAAKLLREVSETSPADVSPVRHGRWVYSTTYRDADTCLCPECEQMMTTHHGERMPFCPGCGEMTVDELVKYWNGGQAPQREDV